MLSMRNMQAQHENCQSVVVISWLRADFWLASVIKNRKNKVIKYFKPLKNEYFNNIRI